jgi:hypothetical protein
MGRRADGGAATFGLRPRLLTRARTLGFAVLVAIAGGALPGCAVSPADREATSRAWAERDAERASECTRGRFVAGGCAVGGGP